jgi:4-carboxymuconolactone decarboxylase
VTGVESRPPRGRITLLSPDRMTESQRAVYDAITSGPRTKRPGDFALCHEDGSLVGPFNALVHAGEIGMAVQSLGAAIRFRGSLDARCRELAILLVARHRRAAFEWFAHAPIALRVGLSADVVEAVRLGEVPRLADRALAVSHDVAVELLVDGRVSPPAFERAVGALGEALVVELVLVVGYYGMLADVLNGFDIGAPCEDPFVAAPASPGPERPVG